jgi:para-nitrobenzyl esterase
MSAGMPTVRQTVAETTCGKVRGIEDRGVLAFKGMPYAATTAGANRFLPPQPAPKWAGIRDALQWGASAPQVPNAGFSLPFYAWYAAIEPMNEDCLFLNVFTPAIGAGKRPVMVWLHGGGWRNCAGSGPGWNGAHLAREQDVVVVTANHRLNGFGYLALDEADERFADSGNAGMLDLVMALQWVRDNAAAFGGDPNNVTIFGQSGGAAKTIGLLATPAARGLFHKAIIQSTSGGMRIAGREEAARMAAELAEVLGVKRLVAEDLQKLPMDTLLSALEKAPGPFRPVIDSRTFFADPYFPAAPGISSDVPVMTGTTNTETTWYYAAHPDNFSLGFADAKRRVMRFLKLDTVAADALIDAYRSDYAGGTASDILTAITTDYLFKRNALKIADLQSASATAPVYCYVFARETPVGNGRFRSPHSAEVPFIFGTTPEAEAFSGNGSDIQPVTGIMMATWAGFARHGNPNNPAIPEWKAFSESNRQTMLLNAESRLVPYPGTISRAALEGLPYYEYSNDRSSFVKD